VEASLPLPSGKGVQQYCCPLQPSLPRLRSLAAWDREACKFAPLRDRPPDRVSCQWFPPRPRQRDTVPGPAWIRCGLARGGWNSRGFKYPASVPTLAKAARPNRVAEKPGKPTLAEAGINKNLAHEGHKLGALTEPDAVLADCLQDDNQASASLAPCLGHNPNSAIASTPCIGGPPCTAIVGKPSKSVSMPSPLLRPRRPHPQKKSDLTGAIPSQPNAP
jgi:hypothetical protein